MTRHDDAMLMRDNKIVNPKSRCFFFLSWCSKIISILSIFSSEDRSNPDDLIMNTCKITLTVTAHINCVFQCKIIHILWTYEKQFFSMYWFEEKWIIVSNFKNKLRISTFPWKRNDFISVSYCLDLSWQDLIFMYHQPKSSQISIHDMTDDTQISDMI